MSQIPNSASPVYAQPRPYYHNVVYIKCRSGENRIPWVVTRMPKETVSAQDRLVLIDDDTGYVSVVYVVGIAKIVKNFFVYEVHVERKPHIQFFLAIPVERACHPGRFLDWYYTALEVMEEVDYKSWVVASNEELLVFRWEEPRILEIRIRISELDSVASSQSIKF